MTAINPFTILVDTREQGRYWFAGLRQDKADGGRPLCVDTEYGTLSTGDYSIAGSSPDGRPWSDLVCVERKSFEDLISTLASRRDDFKAEHARMASRKFAAVVIEASWTDIFEREHYSRLPRRNVYRTAISWQVRYRVPWMFMGSRGLAEATTFRILEKFWREHNEHITVCDRRASALAGTNTSFHSTAR